MATKYLYKLDTNFRTEKIFNVDTQRKTEMRLVGKLEK